MYTSYIKGKVLGTRVLFKGYSHGNGLLLLLWHHGMCVYYWSLRYHIAKVQLFGQSHINGILAWFKHDQVLKV